MEIFYAWLYVTVVLIWLHYRISKLENEIKVDESKETGTLRSPNYKLWCEKCVTHKCAECVVIGDRQRPPHFNSKTE